MAQKKILYPIVISHRYLDATLRVSESCPIVMGLFGWSGYTCIYIYIYIYIQDGAPKIAKFVYNSNNYGLWYLLLQLMGL